MDSSNNQAPLLKSQNTASLNKQFLETYDLLHQLGNGGRGFVLQAQHKVTQDMVAVKFIMKKLIDPKRWISDLQIPLEIYILSKIKLDGVVRYIENFDDQVYSILVMELHVSDPSKENSWLNLQSHQIVPKVGDFRDSCDLYTYMLAYRTLPQQHCRFIFHQLMIQVYRLHSANIVNGDIKDENILINKQMEIKMIDFGSATLVQSGTPTADIREKFHHGTSQWACPEIQMGHSYELFSAEIWTCGAVLYSLLYGNLPFDFTTAQVVFPWQVKPADKVILGCAMPPIRCTDLLEKMLSMDPNERPSAHQILQHPWLKNGFH